MNNGGLIVSSRSPGNQRRYRRETLRRVSVIGVAQTLDLTRAEISDALSSLPQGRTPTKRDWGKFSKRWARQLDERIHQLERMRQKLSGCIGCGCLSLKICALYNAGDRVSALGTGPRYLLGDPSDAEERTLSDRCKAGRAR